MSIMLLILGLVLFVSLVVVHEWGHFIMARRGGVEVEEFGIGFPPRAMTLGKKKETTYTLNWLPLGGFVKLKGENDSSREKGSFGAAKLSTKVKIMLAGVVMNLVTAFAILTFLALVGLPKIVENQYTYASDTKVTRNDVLIGYVEPGSPAEKAGLQPRDLITNIEPSYVKIKGSSTPIPTTDVCVGAGLEQVVRPCPVTVKDLSIRNVTSITDLMESTKANAGTEVKVQYARAGKLELAKLSLRSSEEVEASKKTDHPMGYMGISPTEYTLRKSTWSAPIVAAGLIRQFTVLTFKGLGSAVSNLFRGNGSAASAQVAGPVGIFVVLKDGSLLGYNFILMIIAVISLTLAIMNVLPIPALDGGRLFVTLIYRALKRPLTKSREEMIHGAGFVALMVLFVVITIVDVRRNF